MIELWPFAFRKEICDWVNRHTATNLTESPFLVQDGPHHAWFGEKPSPLFSDSLTNLAKVSRFSFDVAFVTNASDEQCDSTILRFNSRWAEEACMLCIKGKMIFTLGQETVVSEGWLINFNPRLPHCFKLTEGSITVTLLRKCNNPYLHGIRSRPYG